MRPAWRQFRWITFPLIAAFFTINMVLALKCFLQVFDLIVALTNGGPGTSTRVHLARHLQGRLRGRRVRLPDGQRGVFLIVIVVFSILQLRFLQRREVAL